jgi:hypothetical protein
MKPAAQVTLERDVLSPGQKAMATKRRLGLDLPAIARKAAATRAAMRAIANLAPATSDDTAYRAAVFRALSGMVRLAKARHAEADDPVQVTVTTDELRAIARQQNYCCALTGLRFWSDSVGHHFGPRLPTLDRIVHDGPYSASNVRITLLGVNSLRGRGSDDEMYEVARALIERSHWSARRRIAQHDHRVHQRANPPDTARQSI